MLPRWRARTREEPAGMLPAPGPFPGAQPPLHAIVVFVIVIVTVAWLLAHGYSIQAALEVVAGGAAVTAATVSCLAAAQSAAAR
jgi:hypothetical protein